MNIVTISREFGSGGRELGKRLAGLLDYDYYDKEIIDDMIANKKLDATYVDRVLQEHGWQNIRLTFRHSLSGIYSRSTSLADQKAVIEQIAQAGKNFVIVGRNGDLILKDYHPFNIFVCADMDAKVQRCKERQEGGKTMTARELEQKIRSIDENRAMARDMISGSPWGDRSGYQLIVNTTGWVIKDLSYAVAGYVKCWFNR